MIIFECEEYVPDLIEDIGTGPFSIDREWENNEILNPEHQPKIIKINDSSGQLILSIRGACIKKCLAKASSLCCILNQRYECLNDFEEMLLFLYRHHGTGGFKLFKDWFETQE
jgi:hypothetical protein